MTKSNKRMNICIENLNEIVRRLRLITGLNKSLQVHSTRHDGVSRSRCTKLNYVILSNVFVLLYDLKELIY